MPRPGCLLRSTLVLFGVLFVPFAIWSVYSNWRRNWPNATVLFVLSAVSLWFGLWRDERSWVTAIDELDIDE